jgi:hypothetical protein
MGLKIINHRNLMGRELFGSGSTGPMEWKVTSIQEHYMHYVIFIEQTENGWERKVTLHKHYETNQTGFQYKLECGAEHLFLAKDNIKNMNIFSNYLESFL